MPDVELLRRFDRHHFDISVFLACDLQRIHFSLKMTEGIGFVGDQLGLAFILIAYVTISLGTKFLMVLRLTSDGTGSLVTAGGWACGIAKGPVGLPAPNSACRISASVMFFLVTGHESRAHKYFQQKNRLDRSRSGPTFKPYRPSK